MRKTLADDYRCITHLTTAADISDYQKALIQGIIVPIENWGEAEEELADGWFQGLGFYNESYKTVCGLTIVTEHGDTRDYWHVCAVCETSV